MCSTARTSEVLNCLSWQGFRGYVPKCEQIGYALLNIVPKQQQKVVLATQLTNENNSISRKSGDLNYFWYTESWRNCTLVLCSMSTTAEKNVTPIPCEKQISCIRSNFHWFPQKSDASEIANCYTSRVKFQISKIAQIVSVFTICVHRKS